MTRRTAVAWAAAGVAGAGAAVLAASAPGPPAPVPAPPPVAAGLPDAPGTIPLGSTGPAPRSVAATLAAVPGDRELVWSVRGTGSIRRGPVHDGGPRSGQAIARLAVRPGAEQGVRGLAVAADGRVYASYVRKVDDRMAVAQIGAGAPRLVWLGPRVASRRVGGGLAALPGGRLVVGIGDQGRGVTASRGHGLLGRVVTIDPAGPPRQAAHRRSRGWHDPSALAVGAGGRIWVSDRAGGPDPERIGRADRVRTRARRVAFRRAPIALAVSPGGGMLLSCGLLSGRVDRAFGGLRRGPAPPTVLRIRCRYALAVAGRRVVTVADDGRIHVAATVAGIARAHGIPRTR